MNDEIKVIYSNSQWVLYADGDIDTVDKDYWIQASRLLEKMHNGRTHYDWPIHLGGKSWIDMDAFVSVWLKAIVHNGMEPDLDLLADSIRMGYNKVMLNIAYKRDKYLYDHLKGKLLPEKAKVAYLNPVEALKAMTVDLGEMERFDKWRQGVAIDGKMR
jgi:hypothetical protein